MTDVSHATPDPDQSPAPEVAPMPASLLDVKAEAAEASLLVRRLDAARQDLLELSTRNRLLNTPRRRKRSRALEIVDEQADAVFHLLVEKGRAMSFEPAPEKPAVEDVEETPLAEAEPAAEVMPEVEEGSAGAIFRQPDDDAEPDDASANDHPEAQDAEGDPEETDDQAPVIDPAKLTDRKLQTLLSSEDLQKRLLRTFYDARSSQQEQGVNTLYLALGFLKWYEDERPDKARHAPLLLVPVHLERKNARTRFSLTYDDGEITTNLSLQAKLKAEFGLDLPEVPEVDEDFAPSQYIEQVRAMIEKIDRWEVLGDDLVLSFFSFSKFLMYRDLDPGNWKDGQELTEHPLLTQLLGDAGFPDREPVVPDDVMLDEVIGPREMIHVVPADTSQATAVEAVRQGRNMVVQGPPGTGKSQTIANLIAAAVKEGKKVLFVAEKMAALEVVKRRLTNVGLGDMCLELHSHKARKRAVLDDLEHTLSLGHPKDKPTDSYFEQLAATRDTLNEHARALHTPIGTSGVTPYDAIGDLVRLRAADVAPADFTLDTPASWTADQADHARRTLEEFLEQLAVVGTPGEHPWRGASIDSILPMDLQRLIEKLPDAAASLRGAQQKARALADAVEDDAQLTAGHTQALANLARRLAAAPPMDRDAITNEVWSQQATALAELVEAGLNLTAVRKQLDGKVNDAGWAADLAQTRLDLASFGKSWLRWLNPAYKRAKRQLAAALTGPPPKPLDQRLKLVDQILEAQKALKAIERDDAIGRYAFGNLWRGEASDWDALGKIHGWNRRNDEHDDAARCRELIAKTEDVSPLNPLADDAEAAVASAGRAFEAATGPVQLDLSEAFGVEQVSDVPLGLAAQRIEDWIAQPDGLTRWISVRDRRAAAVAMGMAQLVEQLNDGERPANAPTQAMDAFDMAYYEALLRHTFESQPDLARFTGEAHEHTLEQFRQLDADRLALARHEVAVAHHASLPRGGGEVGQVGLLRREFQKKRRHLPLRRLLREAGLAIQAIKPVFMMSPMSVAQYLEPGGLEFDLMLMDEASQVRPVDALGAVSRCQQIVVVGDDKQLPPTRFFDAMTTGGDEEDSDDTELDTSDLESILGLCTAQNMPSAMLRWHYRSQHPSLIAVSNREFYESNLYVIPSPRRNPEDLGLRFHKITEGHFDRGGTATHRVEAQTIARAVMQHAVDTPDLTLGVGAFSVRQRDAILDEIELLRRENKEAEGFFAEDTEEPFFVKNLENIQGDERDVIFISVGYGPDEDGDLTMNFGPLSNDGGERRLNVLITRAKKRLEVFSSMTADDIDLNRVSKRGPVAFKTFLRFAETGTFDGRPIDKPGGLSVFEQSVVDALQAAGHTVEAHVGQAGFYVDLAVVDPEKPGRYLLGITCDGPGYGACRSARERDSSREFILKMRGWTIHRLWEIDWFNRPQEQLQKIIDAIESAKSGDAAPAGKPRKARPGIEREAADVDAAADRFAGIPTGPYVEAKFKKVPRKDLDELDNFQLIELMTKIVEIETPVHGEEVMRRAADIYKVERMTSKLTRLLESALADAVNAGKLENGLGFYSLPGVSTVDVVRSRADVESSGLRKPEFLPPAEVRFALQQVAAVAIGVSREDVVIEASRLLGFASTRSNLREVIERELEALLGRGVLEDREGAVFVAS
ncbi:MAG: DUF4011 domain-containing protein [Planctomycetota bacterium]